ncbi:glutathione S-transferase family protein [Halovivax cerinus]|uniref:Glutathione S-transferase family protein n=1 Tax=Halovivax cerinus TaxID=1487865 RepID=A0ABD5NNU4_9EURY|nr:glutathione S-transferase family protein [Halovivax cerinus]
MNTLVDGEWRTDAFETTDESGSFDRQETQYRDWIRDDPDARFRPEPDRYHLYVSYACPWAHRTLIARRLLGLEDAIPVSVVDPFRDEGGWQFTSEKDGCTRDRVHDVEYLRELYVRSDPDATCRVTVPVLWDTETDTIVNNESREIMRMFDTAFEEYTTTERTLLPDGTKPRVDEILDEIYEPINNGVYRAGFATEQEPYDEAIDDLFDALDHWDSVLADQRYLAGDHLTEADVAMFTTLIRFDRVYHTHFMCNVRRIVDYDHLWPYLRDVYQTPSVAETVRMDHIAEHYYTTHPDVNPHRIVARGPDLDLDAAHDRDRLGADEPLASSA